MNNSPQTLNPIVQRLRTAMEKERRYANETYYQLLSDALAEIEHLHLALERGLEQPESHPHDLKLVVRSKTKDQGLTFQRLRDVSWNRAQRWHAGKSWSPSDWMTALVGEVGEAANVIKKLNRIRDGLPGNKAGVTEESLRTDLAKELADCQIYLDLLASAIGVDLGEATCEKFNEVSERLGFEEML